MSTRNRFSSKKGHHNNDYNNASRHQIESDCGTMIYHMAIIDFLQEWNFDKKGEAFLKRTLKGRDPDLISCVPPGHYACRFN